MLIFFLSYFSYGTFANENNKKSEEENNDPCGGEYALINLVNRPTVADSTCVVPPYHIVIEDGYQSVSLKNEGHGFNLPELEIRFGLLGESEIVIAPPNYIQQPNGGLGFTMLGIKHRFGYSKNWVLSGETLLTLPSGSDVNGNGGTGITLNALFSYNLTNTIFFQTVFGISSQTLSKSSGSARYNSFNPDLILGWQPVKRLLFYGEVYGQTNTSPSEGPGYNADTGFLYLLTKNVEIDFSVGTSLSGNLGSFKNYLGIGSAFYI